MRVRVRCAHHNGLKTERSTDVRAVNARILGDKGPIPGVTFTFVSKEGDDFIACQKRAGQSDLKHRHVGLIRGN